MKILVQRCPTFGNIPSSIMDVLVGMTFERVIHIVPAPKGSICNVGKESDGGHLVRGEELHQVLKDDGAADDLMYELTEKFGQWRNQEFVFHADDAMELPFRPQAA